MLHYVVLTCTHLSSSFESGRIPLLARCTEYIRAGALLYDDSQHLSKADFIPNQENTEDVRKILSHVQHGTILEIHSILIQLRSQAIYIYSE